MVDGPPALEQHDCDARAGSVKTKRNNQIMTQTRFVSPEDLR
jgi:hypothetical protein